MWRIATTAANATEVEIMFRDMPDSTTRVEIDQRGWDRLGDFGRTWREANTGGWNGVLPAYQKEILVSRHSRPGG